MLPDDPAALTDADLHAHMTTLNDEQLSDLMDRLEAVDIVNSNKQIDLGASALWYATQLGWAVFPLKPRGKQPLTRNGFKDASTDPDTVRAWWTRWPDANIGTPTGPAGCGYDVVDIDGPQGMHDWSELKHAACPEGCCDETFCPAPGPFDVQARAMTPGGPGRHLFINPTGRGNSTRLFDLSIDYRGDGGYVVIPPSIGANGNRYSWITWPQRPGRLQIAA